MFLRGIMQSLANVVITQGGRWSWLKSQKNGDLLSQPGACIYIPAGQSVTYDVCDPAGPTLQCIVVLGTLRFSRNVSTCLTLGTLQLQDGGQLIVKHAQDSPVKTDITFSHDAQLNPVEDPALINIGLQAYHADILISGVPRCGMWLLAAPGSLVNGSIGIKVGCEVLHTSCFPIIMYLMGITLIHVLSGFFYPFTYV